VFEAQAAFDWTNQVGDEHIETLADGLEHDQIERNSRQCVHHTEHLPAVGLGRAVSVTYTEQHKDKNNLQHADITTAKSHILSGRQNQPIVV